MGRRHWLDPLARRLLVATGQIAPATGQIAPAPSPPAAQEPDEPIEQELLALKLRHDPALPLADAEAVRRAAALGWRLDVNRATAADWRRLPGIGEAQVEQLQRLQRTGIQLSGPEDLHKALGWPAERIAAWLPVLAFRWYGDAPGAGTTATVELNRAGPGQLGALGLDDSRVRQLLRERARRPFRDLADLQERLQWPPALLERWIGKVNFTAGPAGPVLPPSPPRRP